MRIPKKITLKFLANRLETLEDGYYTSVRIPIRDYEKVEDRYFVYAAGKVIHPTEDPDGKKAIAVIEKAGKETYALKVRYNSLNSEQRNDARRLKRLLLIKGVPVQEFIQSAKPALEEAIVA